MPSFSSRIIRWQRSHGRHDLPWQGTRDSYRIWLSEIMLQQTQVATVIAYFERFVARFPTVQALAGATPDDVLALWSGLGYYARARNLHHAARLVMERHGGKFPMTAAELIELPGIGRSTAAAIAAFSCGERGAILDGNVRRVLARHAAIASPAALWETAEARLPARGIESYTQGMMDVGASICLPRAPLCLACPVNADCVARIEDRIDEFPARKARAAPRRRRIAMLVVVSRGEVLLEKRPPNGIWGGLWSLPEADVGERPEAALAREWGLEAASITAMEPFEHAFTHYTLEVEPWRVHVNRGARHEVRGARGIWLSLGDLAGAALPAPVRKLLANL